MRASTQRQAMRPVHMPRTMPMTAEAVEHKGDHTGHEETEREMAKDWQPDLAKLCGPARPDPFLVVRLVAL